MPTLGLTLSLMLLAIPSSQGEGRVCMKTGACTCATLDGTIDLSSLDSQGDKPRFFNISATDDTFYYTWNPCSDFNLLNTSFVCSSVAICQGYYADPKGPRFFSLGSQAGVQFEYDDTDTLTMQYVHAYLNATRLTVIRLVCDQTVEGDLIVHGQQPPSLLVYDFELRSKYACVVPFPTTSPPLTVSKETRGPPTTTPSPQVRDLNTIVVLLACIFLGVCLVAFLLVTLICVLLCKLPNTAGVHHDPPASDRHQVKY
ncbi:uncharacterized protein LOC124120018 [Haliotis rufescens]|uniref:uncharacterized protein LOC124120018 n=1 Tax=Haliotis rufescens TaxID=6454 RepID=UPI001EB00207|nr:uncharacterized protein LOC124120018 [Haliotis rufescens]